MPQSRWSKLVPHIEYHHVIMSVIAIAVVAWSLVLAGCSNTSGMVNFHILSVSYSTDIQDPVVGTQSPYITALANLTQNANLEVRGSFFGICVRRPNLMPGRSPWDCDKPGKMLGVYNDDVDPLRLVEYVYTFVSKIEFYGLILGCQALLFATFTCLNTFPGWHTVVSDDGSEHEIKPFPSRTRLNAIGWMLAWAIGFGLISIVWIHVGAVSASESLRATFSHLVKTSLGTAALSLGWMAVTLTAVAFSAMIIMILSINLLDRLVERDDASMGESQH